MVTSEQQEEQPALLRLLSQSTLLPTQNQMQDHSTQDELHNQLESYIYILHLEISKHLSATNPTKATQNKQTKKTLCLVRGPVTAPFI